MGFEGARALELARGLSFPRAVGSEGEALAASLIEQQLRAAGTSPMSEEFSIPLNPWSEMKRFSLVALVWVAGCRGLAFFSPAASGFLMLILFAIVTFQTYFWLKFWGSEKAFQGLTRIVSPKNQSRSRNLTASIPSSDPSRRSLFLIAHYDTKSQSLSPVIRVFGVLALSLGAIGLGLSCLRTSPEEIRSVFPFLPLDLPLALATAGILPFFRMTSGNHSPGALDNAGSVGILLHLAEILRKTPLRATTVHLLFTGAEEVGLQGAFAFLRRHRREMNPENCWFINLDCLGVKGKTQVISQNGVPFHFQKSPLMRHLIPVARRFAIRFAPITFGIWMDHLPFLAKGFPAVSLACFTSRILAVHSPGDRFELLEAGGVEEVGRFLLAFAHEVDLFPISPEPARPSR